MDETQSIPGEERLFEYLRQHVGEGLNVQGPISAGYSPKGHIIDYWHVRNGEDLLGIYSTKRPTQQSLPFKRKYRGKIPDYSNPLVVAENQGKNSWETMPEGLVELVISTPDRSGIVQFSDKSWKRRDGHDTIPFG
jgi:hypothetical protein